MSLAQQQPKAAASPGRRPTGLSNSIFIDSSCLQHQAASNSQAEPASQPLLVTNLKPLSATAAAAAAACSSSPKGRSSACPSPKLPKPIQTAAAAGAQLKGLQRTPLSLILARMKVLLERLHMLSPDGACASAAQSPKPQRPATPKPPAAASFFLPDSSPGAATTTTTTSGSGSSSTPGARAQRGTDRSWGAKPGRKPAKGLIEVSTTGGLGQSVMQQSAQSVLDELDVTLGFISEFLQSLPAETRRALATVARLESYKKEQLVFDIGDKPSHFYVILSGQIDIWSHPPGTHRPKCMVSVLRRGEAFGDQAIIHSEPHSTAASAATNVTLLVVDKQDFMTVLGSHFLDAAAEWQRFLVTHVTPLGDCDPAMMRRLCSTLVSDKPAAGQECDVHAEQVCFIQAGTFELRLVDLQAKQAAEAALAAAIASASSALPIAPIPEHLRLGPGGMHVSRGASSRRPASAPPGAHRPVPASDASSAAAAAAAPAAGGGAGGSQGAAAGGALGASVAAGLDLLQVGLADCPAMGAEGVLASVRVKNGRLVGTQGLAKHLRQQHNMSVPYKLLAELGPGGWFGGGEAIYGAGPLQAALQVVAVGPDCVVLHVHLSGLSKHGGPGLIKKLRDDAAFKVTYYLGRVGVLPPLGMAVRHPDSTLVSQAAATAAAAAALEAASMSARGPGGGTAGPLLAAPAGHGAGSANRSRPASARPAAAAVAITGGGGARSRVSNAASSRPQSAAAAAVATGGGKAAARSRPASATQKGGSKGGVTALRRSSSADSCVSTAWDDAQIGVMPPAAGEAGSTAAAPPVAHAETTAAAAAAVTAPPGADSCSLVMTGSFLPKASRVRQKRVHVPGSGVFSPGVMAALQHVSALQAAGAAMSAVHDTASSSTHSTYDQPPALPAAGAAALGAVSGGQAAPGGGHQTTGRRSTLFQPSSTAAGAGSILDGAASASDSASSSIALGSAGCRARPRSAGVRACTAADVFWGRPEHNATATGTALTGLLSSLFQDGLQPLVTELDCLLSHAVCTQNTPLLLQQQQQWRHQLHPQRCTPLTEQQPQAPQQPALRPASAAARLQRPMSSREAAPGQTVLWGRQRQPSQQPQQPQQQCGRGYHGQQQELPNAGLLRHKPETSLLAASVMWQRSSEAAFRPPLRQCLTSEEVARCRIAGSTDGCGDAGVL